MKEEILANLNNPTQLERLYRADKPAFKQAFNALYPDLQDHTLSRFWQARLHYAKDELSWGSGRDLVFVLLASLVAGLIAKLPAFAALDETFFYPRNIGFVLFPALMAYFARKNKLAAGTIALLAGAMMAGLVFINALPVNPTSNTLILSCIHLLLFLWCVVGLAFVGHWRNREGRLAYLKYNGDLVVMTTLILIAGGIMTAITIGLFSLIGYNIQEFYFENVVVFGLPAAPIFGTYLIRTNPQLVGKVSPVIARLFSPLVLVMLVIYLVAMVASGKDPYNDREFLLVFNALLLGVMAIIFFSVSEGIRSTKTRAEIWVLFLLSAVTVLVNGIALSAILFRISAWGLTPNRAAVLGGNVLILVNLVLVTTQLVKILLKKADATSVGNTIAQYLPVYFAWAAIVTFLFPFLFGFR